MGKFTNFSQKEKDRIRKAVEELERATSGELRPVFVRRSDDYVESRWFGACIGVVVGIGMVLLLSYTWLLPANIGTPLLFSVLLGMMIAGFLVPVAFPSIGVQLAGRDRTDTRVMQRATEVFVTEEVFHTAKRIGILLMVSEMERKIVLLADSGINSLVEQSAWDEIVQSVIDRIRNGAYADGIVEAIHKCRDLLLANGFTPGTDERNELPDDIRTIE